MTGAEVGSFIRKETILDDYTGFLTSRKKVEFGWEMPIPHSMSPRDSTETPCSDFDCYNVKLQNARYLVQSSSNKPQT